jgi:uncharacterized phage-like protein YoqJ
LDIRYQNFRELMHGRDDSTDVEFVTGGALGIDTYATEWAYVRGIPYHIILPFPFETMSKFWPEANKATLRRHLEHAASIKVIGTTAYEVQRYQERNEAMVDRADEVWTYWMGKTYGGTWNCIQYALKVGKPVFNIREGRFIPSRTHCRECNHPYADHRETTGQAWCETCMALVTDGDPRQIGPCF